MNVKELRAFLDAEERKWDDFDRKHLGEFENQSIYQTLESGKLARTQVVSFDACSGVVLDT